MKWLNKIVDELVTEHPEGGIVVSSGVSPSGTYHLGTLREVLTAEAIAWESRRRGHKAKHLHVVDDLDVFRKLPVNLPPEYKQYLGKPLCEVPAPDGSGQSYADYYLKDLSVAAKKMHLDMDIIKAHEKYQNGYFVRAIEKALEQKEAIKKILEDISGQAVDENWSPVQVIEDGYLKNRPLVSFDKTDKTLIFKDKNGQDKQISYAGGEVKLNWRVDWPARWWLLGVNAEPFGRDHATKGGSYETGAAIIKDIFEAEPPLPLPYNFINRSGDTKKMSKSAGDVITATELLEVLPAEVVWFFVLRYSPDKQLFFDDGPTLVRTVDEFGELLAKSDPSEADKQLLSLCLHGVDKPTVSRVPFSLLVASYQAALKDTEKTLEIIRRSEYSKAALEDADIITEELRFIDVWLQKLAPEDVKFSLLETIHESDFTDTEKQFLASLAEKIKKAPEDVDGAWFHQAIYAHKDNSGLSTNELFAAVYRVLIGKQSGPRAGWFLSILPRDWLIERLSLKV